MGLKIPKGEKCTRCDYPRYRDLTMCLVCCKYHRLESKIARETTKYAIFDSNYKNYQNKVKIQSEKFDEYVFKTNEIFKNYHIELKNQNAKIKLLEEKIIPILKKKDEDEQLFNSFLN
jgi:hypothetical protein